ncbi:MAG: RagB/SusD family nutrient uptake outer membrane protein, partial [Chitinophagaceae bacterium]
MKKFRHITAILSLVAVSAVFDSCSKSFLEKPVLGSLSEEVLANDKGLQRLLIGTYAALDGQNVGGGTWESAPDNWIYGSVAGADAHKGSDATDQPPIDRIGTGNSDPSNGFFNAKWVANYEGIARANAVLRVAALAEDISAENLKLYQGEARFLRAHYYFDLKKMFNMVPYVDETVDYGTGIDKVPNNVDIWSKIEADFKYAQDNLPATQSSVGRANKWAAAAYLAKAGYEVEVFEKNPEIGGRARQLEVAEGY